MIFSKFAEADNSFQETQIYKNIPAVKNNRVFELDGSSAGFSDPITLDRHLDFIINSFLGESY